MTLTTMPTHNSSMCIGLAWALGHAQHTAAGKHPHSDTADTRRQLSTVQSYRSSSDFSDGVGDRAVTSAPCWCRLPVMVPLSLWVPSRHCRPHAKGKRGAH